MSTCPACGSIKAYVGLSQVECDTYGCVNYIQSTVPSIGGFVTGVHLNFTNIAPYVASLPFTAKDEQVGCTLHLACGRIIPPSKWKFLHTKGSSLQNIILSSSHYERYGKYVVNYHTEHSDING